VGEGGGSEVRLVGWRGSRWKARATKDGQKSNSGE
jgi:hypothetical protein